MSPLEQFEVHSRDKAHFFLGSGLILLSILGVPNMTSIRRSRQQEQKKMTHKHVYTQTEKHIDRQIDRQIGTHTDRRSEELHV